MLYWIPRSSSRSSPYQKFNVQLFSKSCVFKLTFTAVHSPAFLLILTQKKQRKSHIILLASWKISPGPPSIPVLTSLFPETTVPESQCPTFAISFIISLTQFWPGLAWLWLSRHAWVFVLSILLVWGGLAGCLSWYQIQGGDFCQLKAAPTSRFNPQTAFKL